MPSVLTLTTILCASVAIGSDLNAAPQLRGAPGVSSSQAETPGVSSSEAETAGVSSSEGEAPGVSSGEAETPTPPAAVDPVVSAVPAEATKPTAPEPVGTVDPLDAETPLTFPEPTAESEDEDEDVEPPKPVSRVNETKLQEKRELEEGGTCCFSGESSKDTCGTCYPMSIASYKSKCSLKSECGHCGGTWCTPKCAIGAADPLKKCQTAYPTGISSDPQCSKDKASCNSCNGEWCRAGYDSNFVIVEGTHGREVPEYVPPEDETLGICCYRGEAESKDMCGACADVAKDSTCSVKSRCAGCGGTWCPGPRCVKAFADKDKPCHSAFPLTGIAKADDFCSLNEKQCTNCKGAWCPVGNITFSDGTKYDPSHPYVPEPDQRLEPEDPKETAAAEEEVEHDPSLDDLFPDGLA